MVTPLLVPSFSSTAFPNASDVRAAMNVVKPHLRVSYLISAFDIHRGLVDKEVAMSDLVFVDSGNYEKTVLDGQGCTVEWTRKMHKDALNSMVPMSQVAVVNFDEAGTISDQIESARSFFDAYPRYASDFLCKPMKGSPYIDVEEVGKYVNQIEKFDVLGVTEKELGASVLERCKNVARLRSLLNSSGCEIPIHLFGCFEPSTAALMCSCGADIFDGLTWTRFAVKNDSLVYTGSVPFMDGTWSKSEVAIRVDAASRHLSRMTDLMLGLRSFARNHDYGQLGLQEASAELVKAITTQVAEEVR